MDEIERLVVRRIAVKMKERKGRSRSHGAKHRRACGRRNPLPTEASPTLAPAYSTVTPLALMGPAHFSISLLTNWPRYSGVARSLDTTCTPRPCSRSRTAGVFIDCTTALLSFFTI